MNIILIRGVENAMQIPHYLDLSEARQTLSEIGIDFNDRQIKRAAEPDAHGKRKLPFFIDPIDGRLKIEKGRLLGIYRQFQLAADDNLRYNDDG